MITHDQQLWGKIKYFLEMMRRKIGSSDLELVTKIHQAERYVQASNVVELKDSLDDITETVRKGMLEGKNGYGALNDANQNLQFLKERLTAMGKDDKITLNGKLSPEKRKLRRLFGTLDLHLALLRKKDLELGSDTVRIVEDFQHHVSEFKRKLLKDKLNTDEIIATLMKLSSDLKMLSGTLAVRKVSNSSIRAQMDLLRLKVVRSFNAIVEDMGKVVLLPMSRIIGKKVVITEDQGVASVQLA
jgi:hypothetical protein